MSLVSDYESEAVIVGHRGFKAKYTENTLHGFEKCFGLGATSIETDVWLTKDQVVIISHDVSTKRIFCDAQGNPTDYNILETNYYDTLKNLQTIELGEKLLTFRDVLSWFYDYVKQHDSNSHKLMLDIKRFNPTKLIKYLIKDLLHVHNDLGWWLHRIQFGIWDLSFIKYLNQDDDFQKLFSNIKNPLGFKQFEIIHISFSWRDSLHYLRYNAYLDEQNKDPDSNLVLFKVSGVSLLYLLTWSIQFLTVFVSLLKHQDLSLYSWTINNFQQFDYLLALGRISNLREFGVVTDHPDLMVDHMNGQTSLSNSSDDELATELTRLTTSHESWVEKQTLHLTWEQRFAHFLFVLFQRLAQSKMLTKEELQFDSIVDENEIRVTKPNPFFGWVFSTCQKFGIF